MTSLDQGQPGDNAASRRNVLFGGLAAAATLAPFPNTTIAAHAQDAIRPAGRPSTGVHRPSFITTNDGIEIYYKDWGKGPPVVFSHGWPLNADVWDDQMMFMASRGFRCVAFDRRGHGRSSQPWEGNDYDTFAEDLSELIAALDLKAAALVGHSAGAGDIARYIGRYGTAGVSGAVLVSAISAADRSSAPTARARRFRRASRTLSGFGACRSGCGHLTKASRPSPRLTSRKT